MHNLSSQNKIWPLQDKQLSDIFSNVRSKYDQSSEDVQFLVGSILLCAKDILKGKPSPGINFDEMDEAGIAFMNKKARQSVTTYNTSFAHRLKHFQWLTGFL